MIGASASRLKLGDCLFQLQVIHDIMIRHYVHSRVLRYLGHVFRMDADRTPSLLQRCWVVDGKHWQPSGKIKVLYDSAVQKLLDEVGLSLLDAANKSEWHNMTRPSAGRGARCSGSRGIRGFSPSCRQTALSGCCHQGGCIIHITSSCQWRLGNGIGNLNMQT